MIQEVKYLVVGASAAGVSAANALVRLDPQARTLCVTAEQVGPYNKCFLVDWLVGERLPNQLDLNLLPAVELQLGMRVISINPQQRVARLSNGDFINYQKCLLAIGAQPFRPPIIGSDLAHVFNFHDFHDVQQLMHFISQNTSKRAIVIGAGLTGLECADALWRLGLRVTVVERSSQVLGSLVDAEGAQHLQVLMQAVGVELRSNLTVAEIKPDGILLDSGEFLDSDLVVVAAGVRPNQIQVEGMDFNRLGQHLLVNEYFQTNLPNVWAAGDVVAVPDLLTGRLVPTCSWPDAMQQGNLAAQSMVGQGRPYQGLLSIAKSKLFGQEIVSFGSLDGDNRYPGQLVGTYRKCLSTPSGLIGGAILIGDLADYPKLRRIALTKQRLEL